MSSAVLPSRAGTVVEVLSGDSFVVIYDENGQIEHQLVVLAEVKCPRFSVPGCEASDEPHAFDCFNFLRELLIGKRVLVTESAARTPRFGYSSTFGEIPAVFGLVELLDRVDKDLSALVVSGGYGFVRYPESKSARTVELVRAQDEAKHRQLGVWRPGGLVRELEVLYEDTEILARGVVDGYVSRCDTATSFYFTVLPGLEVIPIGLERAQLIKGKARKAKSLVFAHRHLLNRTLRLALKSLTGKGMFVADVVSGFDYPYLELALKSGAAEVDSGCELLIPFQKEAQQQKLGIWAEEDESVFVGVVHRVVGSVHLEIFDNKVMKTFQLNGILAPPFNVSGKNDMKAFEAREELRKYVGRSVEVVPVGCDSCGKALANVYDDGHCLNVLMCEKGLARIGHVQGRALKDEILTACSRAKSLGIGVHQNDATEPFDVLDIGTDGQCQRAEEMFEQKNLAGLQREGIIEMVLPGPRFLVLIPSIQALVRLALFGINGISVDDMFQSEAIEYCQRMYTQRDCTVELLEIGTDCSILANIVVQQDDVIGNIAVDLTSRGYTEIQDDALAQMTDDDAHALYQAQRAAQARGLGKWSFILSKPLKLSPNNPVQVAVIDVWSVDNVAVQLQTSELEQIKSLLIAHSHAMSTIDTIRKRTPVILWYKGSLARGIVAELFEPSNRFRVTLLDYGFDIDVSKHELYQMPRSLLEFPPQACVVRLAFLSSTESPDSVRQYIKGLCDGVLVYMHYVHEADLPEVILTDSPSLQSGSINLMLLSYGYAQFVKTHVFPIYQPYAQGLAELCM